ncbi:hypothetical protein GE09DRAFT_1211200 [Coniochaeta sp. 2T2.1]|nr:hypothetical protein GE09DRAFT_1211200 [Coniochaeta sp. 2T2.1]
MARHFNWETFRTNPSPEVNSNFGLDATALCSRLGINPDTLHLATTLCNAYAIPQQGKDAIAKAFEDKSITPSALPTSNSTAKDIGKLINTLASSDAGLSFLAVCAVIGTYYTLDSIPKIFSELAAESAVPPDLVPTPQDWETLKPLYANFRGPPAFTALVDRYTNLYIDTPAYQTKPLEHHGPKSVVIFLYCISLIIGDLAVGRTDRSGILVLAGKDAGWAAAVAEWLFGLEIRLRMGPPSRVPVDSVASEGLLYSNCGEGEGAQVTVCFAHPGVPVDGEPFVETPLGVRQRG